MKVEHTERQDERLQRQPERLEGQSRQSERLTTADLARAAQPGTQAERSDVGGTAALRGGPERGSEAPAALFPPDVMNEFKSRWTDVQTGFVDTPREAVERADELVAEAIKRLAESFSQERAQLEAQWAREGDVSTEDLRVALQRYRSFFERLLHA